jgi:hypothetical protein
VRYHHGMPSYGRSDTSPDAQFVRDRLLRESSESDRFAMCRRMTAEVLALSRRALARARPELTPAELSLEWIAIHYGRDLADAMRRRVRAAT